MYTIKPDFRRPKIALYDSLPHGPWYSLIDLAQPLIIEDAGQHFRKVTKRESNSQIPFRAMKISR